MGADHLKHRSATMNRPPIIAAIDPHRPDDAPLALATRLAALIGAPVIAAAVVLNDGISSVPTPEWQRLSIEHSDRILDERVAALNGGAAVTTRTEVSTSAPRGLHELAVETGAAVVVAGSSHYGPIGRVLLGSVTDRLLIGAPCPIAVTPHGASTDGDFARIGVAYDASAESRAALTAAQRIAERAGGRVRVLIVVESPPPARPGWPGPSWSGTADPDIRRRLARAAVDKALEALPDAVRGAGDVRHGYPAEQLGLASNELDLLVCGSRGYGPARAVLLGSVSRALTQRCRCPLLVLPHDAGDPLPSFSASAAGATAR
jgi:nucleotide-binding universal stress UspA family protein